MLIDALVTWRLTKMLTVEAGPFDIFIKLREFLGIRHNEDGQPIIFPAGILLSCFWCTSVWVAGPASLLPKPIKYLLAVSTLAILVDENGTK